MRAEAADPTSNSENIWFIFPLSIHLMSVSSFPLSIHVMSVSVTREQIEAGRNKEVLHNTSACEVFKVKGRFGIQSIDAHGPVIVIRRTKITGTMRCIHICLACRTLSRHSSNAQRHPIYAFDMINGLHKKWSSKN